MVAQSLRIEERFIPGEYLIKAYPELWFNRRKGYAGFLTNMRLFFGDGRRLYDLSLGSVESLKWARERRLSLFWITVVLAVEFVILLGAPILDLILMIVTLLLGWLWREEALVMTVGHRRHLIFAQTRVLNDIARNIRLHQAVLRSGEAGAVLGQRILEAMPMEPKVPPPEGGPLADEYASHLAHSKIGKDSTEVTPTPSNSIPEDSSGSEGLGALRKLEAQADLAERSQIMQLAYKLWAGRPKWTRIFWALGLVSVYLALLTYVVADVLAYFDDRVASPWIRAAQILVLIGLLFFLWFFLRMADNRHRGVEPHREEIVLKLGYRDIPLRVVCNSSGYFILFASLALTYVAYNLQFFLYGLVTSSLILAFGRAANLVRMPQWLHLTRPWPKGRTLKLGLNGARVVSVIWLFLLLAPFFAYHDAALPANHQDPSSHNGWQLEEKHSFSRGLGAIQGGLRIYVDDGRDEEGDPDGYPAMLVLITLKEPRDFLLERLMELIDQGMAEQLTAQKVEQLERLANQTRTTVQGYQTHFVIYNATAEGSTFFTKGEQMRLIGEGWYAEREQVMVVAIGLAQISTETLDREPDPPEEVPEPVRQVWEVIWEQLPEEVKKSDPPIDPTNTTDTRNWLELYDLIPHVVAW